MKEWKIFQKILGVFLVLIGLISYLVPVPGSTLLIVLGLVSLVGKNKTLYFLREILGKKFFKFLKIRNIGVKKVFRC